VPTTTVTVKTVKALRDMTGAGVMDCKNALGEAGGDLQRAADLLRTKGAATAERRAGRETNQGLVQSYIHSGNRMGALVEINCETDFVARTDEFRELAHNLAMQVAAMNPQYLDRENIPADLENLANPEELCLLQQPYIRDGNRSVQDMVNEVVARTGEKVQVRRFIRFALGE
jgi:elongation factor Ts